MEPQTDATTEPDRVRPTVTNEISREMVRLYKDLFGRGPTKVRSGFVGPDTLICTIENSLTPAERNLAKAGEDQRLRELRVYFQHSSEQDFIEAAERVTGRQVRAFSSGIDTQNDVATEAFYFVPRGETSSRRPDELSPQSE